MINPDVNINLIQNMIRIPNKDREIVPFILSPTQRYLAINKGHHNVIVKARQMGKSLYILADMFVTAITIEGTRAAILSHDRFASKNLLERLKFIHKHMNLPNSVKPELGKDNESEISFPGMDSKIYVGTPNNFSFGRGDTLHYVLLSECAFYENFNEVKVIEDALASSGTLFMETTPNGEGDFYDFWCLCREGKTTYKSFFFPWYLHGEYALPRGSELALVNDRDLLHYSGEESELVDKFNLTEDQIRWRRMKIANKGRSFFIEYPEDEMTCFQMVGDPVFSPDILYEMSKECYEGIVEENGFSIWEEPTDDGEYVIGVDCSEGSVTSSAAGVLNKNDEFVATFMAKLDPEYFAQKLYNIGKKYNWALLAVERNQPGYAVLAHLKNLGYPNLYIQHNFTTGESMGKPGWWTNEQTRNYLFSTFRDSIEDIGVYDIRLVRQARGYKYVKLNQSIKPKPTGEDDLLIASMIAVAVKKDQGGSRGFIGQVPGYGDNWGRI